MHERRREAAHSGEQPFRYARRFGARQHKGQRHVLGRDQVGTRDVTVEKRVGKAGERVQIGPRFQTTPDRHATL